MSDIVSQFQELIATGLWVPITVVLLLGIVLGISIMNIFLEIKKFKKDMWLLLFFCAMLLFGLIWITTPNMLDDVGILATFVVALLTFRTLDEIKATRVSQTRPEIIVDIDIRHERGIFDLHIKNIGKGVGYNFTSTWSPELIDTKGNNFSDLELLKKIEYFPPDKLISTIFESTPTYFLKKPPLPRMYKVDVTYSDENDRKYENTYNIDLSIYEKITYISGKNLGHVVSELEKINRNIRSRARS